MAAAGVLALALAGCGGGGAADSGSAGTDKGAESSYKVTMVTDMGGVNDQSFNELAWKGAAGTRGRDRHKVSYTESKQESDYGPKPGQWPSTARYNSGLGASASPMANAIETAAKQNPDVNFAIIDNAYENTPTTVTGVVFRAQGAFLPCRRYIAAMTTQTGKVGFVGGMQSVVIDQFEWGYKAGVEYANKTQGKNVTVDVQYLRELRRRRQRQGHRYQDVLRRLRHRLPRRRRRWQRRHRRPLRKAGKLVIGVDKDQSSLAPENVLTSAMKKVDVAVLELSKKAINGDKIGGQTVEFGMTDDAVGIPRSISLMADEVLQPGHRSGGRDQGRQDHAARQ